ncbi:MAG: hypothetical protein U9P71_07710 [Campylobacterota bacterium]|nr:hypothetical protein [Campylobacterota bacterium]
MHTLQLKIDDSIFDKFMGLIEMLPRDKVTVMDDNSVSFEEAKMKVQNALNNVSQNNGIKIDTAFEKVLNS